MSPRNRRGGEHCRLSSLTYLAQQRELRRRPPDEDPRPSRHTEGCEVELHAAAVAEAKYRAWLPAPGIEDNLPALFIAATRTGRLSPGMRRNRNNRSRTRSKALDRRVRPHEACLLPYGQGFRSPPLFSVEFNISSTVILFRYSEHRQCHQQRPCCSHGFASTRRSQGGIIYRNHSLAVSVPENCRGGG